MRTEIVNAGPHNAHEGLRVYGLCTATLLARNARGRT